MPAMPPQPPQPRPTNIWNVTFTRNTNMTGREAVLREMRQGFLSNDPIKKTQAIHGLGGGGKTQLAMEYAYRFRDEYALVWWVRAEEPTTMMEDFLGLSGKIIVGRDALNAEP